MKKTISANIGGLVFHIEEDAFQILSVYLENLRKHYASMEGGAEILTDIEARVAELFTSFLRNGRQAVTLQDAELVMKQVGSVEAITGESGEDANQQAGTFAERETVEMSPESSRLYRDLDRAIAGGVCSGIALRFALNPIWTRLAFVVLFFGGIPFLPELAVPILFIYLGLWIAIPGKKGLKNPGSLRQFFLSSRDKVLGGVCGGIGRYFHVDPTLIRIGFVLALLLGGSGIILYLILWIITPQASSISDEIKMEGRQINLQTLEEQVKKRIEPDPVKPESIASKLLLFPFRLISILIEVIKPLLVLIVDLSRIFAGLFLLFLGLVLVFVFGATLMSLLGYFSNPSDYIHAGDFPIDQVAAEVSPWLIGMAGLSLIIPSFLILALGVSLMVKRAVPGRIAVISLLGFFIISVFGTSLLLIPKVREFQEESAVVKNMEFSPGGSIINLRLNQTGEKRESGFPYSIRIVSSEGNSILLRQRFKARGRSPGDAKAHARHASLSVVQVDSTLIFDPRFQLKPSVPYRAQTLELILYLPEGSRFRMDSGLQECLENAGFNDSMEGYGDDAVWTLRGNELVPEEKNR